MTRWLARVADHGSAVADNNDGHAECFQESIVTRRVIHPRFERGTKTFHRWLGLEACYYT